ncbi:hypothetical protein NDU88_001322 [Pleurodeles waltl]|uniref:Uncharacterized protein n=1 Tax=Pleurodeles waltl TaxID=8319 RepID=A0AAV7VZQ5_PLEWA|nr:hypothetical protein NDU88_001322 [Pleurodeles waltl]
MKAMRPHIYTGDEGTHEPCAVQEQSVDERQAPATPVTNGVPALIDAGKKKTQEAYRSGSAAPHEEAAVRPLGHTRRAPIVSASGGRRRRTRNDEVARPRTVSLSQHSRPRPACTTWGDEVHVCSWLPGDGNKGTQKRSPSGERPKRSERFERGVRELRLEKKKYV